MMTEPWRGTESANGRRNREVNRSAARAGKRRSPSGRRGKAHLGVGWRRLPRIDDEARRAPRPSEAIPVGFVFQANYEVSRAGRCT